MNREQYVKVSSFVRKYKRGPQTVALVNKVLSLFVVLVFVAMMIYGAIYDRNWTIRAILVTSISFLLVTIIRKVLNTDRPYVVYDFEQIVDKKKQGESMPSRHVFSAFIISIVALNLYIPLGIIMIVISIMIGIGRLVSCVHFPKDIVVGMIIGIVAGVLGMYII